MAVDAKGSGVALTVSALERVDRVTDGDVDESGFLNQCGPACTRQATGDSTGPQVYFALGLFRHRFAVCNIRELQNASLAQHPKRFREDPFLVRA